MTAHYYRRFRNYNLENLKASRSTKLRRSAVFHDLDKQAEKLTYFCTVLL